MRISADDAFWTYPRLADLIARMQTAAIALGVAPQPPRPMPIRMPGDPEPRPWPVRDGGGRLPWDRGGQPVFGGIDDGEEGETASPNTRRRQHASTRLRVRALLYGNPFTPCKTDEVAQVFGLRESDVRAARPAAARRVGRAWMAPFGMWLRSMQVAGLLPVWDENWDGEPLAAAPAPTPAADLPPRRGRGASSTPSPTLRPLGGPRER